VTSWKPPGPDIGWTRASRVLCVAACLALFAVAPAAQVPRPAAAPSTSPSTAAAADPLFDPSVLHDIRLTLAPENWETLQRRYMGNDYYPADMQWRDQTVPMVGIRSHGTGSRNEHKPGLRIDFNRYVDQTFLKLKSIVLANAIQDPSMLRQRLAMRFYAKMGVPAPRVAHARLFVNDRYVGLYELTESLDKVFLGRAFERNEQGKKRDDGFLFEYLWRDAYEWDYLGSDLGNYAGLFEPKTHEQYAPVALYGPIESMFRAINDARDEAFEADVGQYVDLRRFVRFLAVDRFLADNDGFLGFWGPNNFYLYRFADTGRSELIPWDKDSAFYDWHWDLFENVDRNVLARRTLAVPALRRAYLEDLLECVRLATAPEPPESRVGWLEAEVLRVRAQIAEATRADENKGFPMERVDDELDKVLVFVRQRISFVAAEARKQLERTPQGAR
jgi:spore coat protein CotH